MELSERKFSVLEIENMAPREASGSELPKKDEKSENIPEKVEPGKDMRKAPKNGV